MFSYLKRGPLFYRDLISLSVPIILQNLVTSSLGLLDTLMVGMLPGEVPMAAVALANIPLFVLQLIIFGLQSGSTVLISQYWGKGDKDTINRVIGLGVYVAGGMTGVFALVVTAFPAEFMGLFTNNGALIPLAVEYIRIVAFAFFFNSMTQIYIGAQRSMERPQLGLVVLASSMCIDTFLNWVLIFGKLGAPAMGVAGAALATLIARIIEFGITVGYAACNRRFRLRPRLLLRPGRPLVRQYIRYASPVLGNELLWGLGTAIYPTVMGYMDESTEILAAYTVAGNVDRIVTVAVFAVGMTAAILVGREIGAGRAQGVQEVGYALNLISVLVGAGLGCGLMAVNRLVFPDLVFPLFDLSDRTAEITGIMVTISACTLPLRAFNTTNVVGVLRGGGDVRMAGVIDLAPLWLLSLPLVAATGLVLRWDIAWVQLMAVSENVAKAALGMWRLRSGKWVRDLTVRPASLGSPDPTGGDDCE